MKNDSQHTNTMKKILMLCEAMVAMAFGVSAQNIGDSVIISGRILLDFEETDCPTPYEQIDVLIDNHYMILDVTKTNSDGFFSFKMPKGKYRLWLYNGVVFKDYGLFWEKGTNNRDIDAQTNVHIGDWYPIVSDYIQFYPNGQTQKMKIDGVKVTVQ